MHFWELWLKRDQLRGILSDLVLCIFIVPSQREKAHVNARLETILNLQEGKLNVWAVLFTTAFLPFSFHIHKKYIFSTKKKQFIELNLHLIEDIIYSFCAISAGRLAQFSWMVKIPSWIGYQKKSKNIHILNIVFYFLFHACREKEWCVPIQLLLNKPYCSFCWSKGDSKTCYCSLTVLKAQKHGFI